MMFIRDISNLISMYFSVHLSQLSFQIILCVSFNCFHILDSQTLASHYSSIDPSFSPMSKWRRLYTPTIAAEIITDWDTDDGSIDSDVPSDQEKYASFESSDDETSSICSNSQGDASLDDVQVQPEPQGDELSLCASSSTEIRLGRNGTPWKSVPKAKPGRTAGHNIFTARLGVPNSVRSSISTPYEAWKHFITEKMLRDIVKYTKKQAERVGDDKFELTIQELETFIGLQYARGVYGKNHPIEFLWNIEFGIPLFRNSMPRDRFKTILKHLRFDDRTKRSERNQQNDKFAPIRDLRSYLMSL